GLPYCFATNPEWCHQAPTLAASDTGREASARPRPNGAPIDCRLWCYNGFLCDLCLFRTISKLMIVRHLGIEHSQSWVRNPSRSQYWTVSQADAATAEVRPVGRPEELSHLHDALAREEAFRQHVNHALEEPYSAAQEEASRKVAAYTELRPWLERTGWEQVYANVNRQLLHSLTLRPVERSYRPRLLAAGLSQQYSDIVSPADDEAKIAALCRATSNVISRYEETAKTSGRNILCWLRSVQPNNCYPKPFTLVARKNTRERYISVLQRFVSLIFRAYRLSNTLRRDVAAVSFTEQHWFACEKVWNHPGLESNTLQRRECESLTTGISTDLESGDREDASDRDEWEENDSDFDDQQSLVSSNDDEGSQFDDPEDCFCDDSGQNECSTSSDTQCLRQLEAEAVEATGAGSLDELLFELIMLFCMQEVQDGDPSQTLLVYFSGILGFTKDFQSFQPPRNYTSHLAALIYIQRLLFLEYAVPQRGYTKMGIPERSRQGSLARLQDVRHRFTVLGAESPFEEMFTLLCFGRKIAANSTPPFVLHWSDDEKTVTVSNGCSITMKDFKSLPKDLIAKADQVCRELLYHLSPIEDLKSVQDDFKKINTGFSFIHHPANRLSKEYLNLCSRACAGTEARLASNGKWRHALVQSYIAKERLFLEHLAVLMHITGGGQPRSSDILHLRTYGLDGAYPVRLQPALVERYRWASSCWHSFLDLGPRESFEGPETCTRRRANHLSTSETPRKKARRSHSTIEEESSGPTQDQIREAALVLRQALDHHDVSSQAPLSQMLLQGLSWVATWDSHHPPKSQPDPEHEALMDKDPFPSEQQVAPSKAGELHSPTPPLIRRYYEPDPGDPDDANADDLVLTSPSRPHSVENSETTHMENPIGNAQPSTDTNAIPSGPKYFDYLPELRLLVCLHCQTCVTMPRIRHHLRQLPHCLGKSEVDKAFEWASSLDIIRGDEELRLLVKPDRCMPIRQLGPPRANGFRCEMNASCSYIGADLRRIREHLRQCHGWEQRITLGRRGKDQEKSVGPWKGAVYY
ncbi:hypothetical protein CSUB01_12380, partial [Colletotrichum sublineola]